MHASLCRRAGNSGTGQEFHVSHPLDPGKGGEELENTARTDGKRTLPEDEERKRKREGKRENTGDDGRTEAREREVSALGISETSLARVTPRPFRRKFKFHGIEVVPACERVGIRKRSFVCALNVQTDVHVRGVELRTSLGAREPRLKPGRGGSGELVVVMVRASRHTTHGY